MNLIDLSFHRSHDSLSPDGYIKTSESNIGYSEFLREKYAVYFIFQTAKSKIIEKEGISFIFRRKKYNSKYLFPIKLLFLIRKLKPDVILVHSLLYIHFAALLSVVFNRKMITLVQHHGAIPPVSSFKKRIIRWSDPYIDGYLFTSKHLGLSWIEKKLIAHPNKVFEVMEGSTNFKPKQRYEKDNDQEAEISPVFLWVGRLDTNKDPMCVLKALRLLKNDGKKFAFYMFYHTTELLSEIKTFIKYHQMENCVFLKGNIAHEQLEIWYQKADFYISSSHKEGSGYALCEAMACACIPIVSNIPSFKYMTRDGYAGLLFDIGDDKGLYQQLQKLYDIDLKKSRKRVLEVFEERLSFKAIAIGIDEVIQTLRAKK